MLLSIVSFIIIFTLVALIHELGHFFSAKKAGIRVLEFGIGFGPKLFSIKKGDTVYAINLLPILAYVSIAGESEDEASKEVPENEKFYAKPLWSRFKVAFNGAFMNIVSAFVVLTLIFIFVGVPKKISNEIETIVKGSVAEKVGLKQGDIVQSINGKSVIKMEDAIDQIHQSGGKTLTLSILRGSKTLNIKAIPQYDPKLKVALIGFSPKSVYEKVGFLNALYYGAQQTVSMIALMFIILAKLFTGAISLRNLAGPVGIAQITGQYAQSGMLSLLHFFAFLSVNIGVVNLLPLPALDGGRIIFILLEALRRKPISRELETKIHQWGMMGLLALAALVTISDVMRMMGR